MPFESLKVGRRVRRVIRKAPVVLLAVLLLSAALIFGLADRIPSDYSEALQRVARLNELPKQEDPRQDFWQHVLGDFSEHIGTGKPFTWSITADEANMYLASMDEIASLSSSKKPVRPSAELARAGFSSPAVAMCDGVLTLMVRSAEYGKVISVDLSFVFDERGDVRMEILAARVGVLPVPGVLLEKQLREFRGKLQDLLTKANAAGKPRVGVILPRDVAKFLRKVVGMLDGKSVRPEVPWKFGTRHRVLITKVEIIDGKLTLHFDPVPRRRPAPSSAPRDGE